MASRTNLADITYSIYLVNRTLFMRVQADIGGFFY